MRAVFELQAYEAEKRLDQCLDIIDLMIKSKRFVYYRIDDLEGGKKRVTIDVPTTD